MAGGEQSAYSEGGIHWICNIASMDNEMPQGDKSNKSGPNGQQYIWDGSKFWFAYKDNFQSSPDGTSWDVIHTVEDGSVTFDTIGYNGRAYLAVGKSGTDLALYYSQDGGQWERLSIPPEAAGNAQQVLPIKGRFLVAGEDLFYVSDAKWNTPSEWASDDMRLAEKNGLVPTGLLRAYSSPITRSEFSRTVVRLYEALTGRDAKPAAVNPFADTSRPTC